MLISSYRSRKFGGACGTRNFSESEGVVLFYINKSSKKKEGKRKERKRKQLYPVKFCWIKKKSFKRAKNKVEHGSGILFLGENFGYQAHHLLFLKETEALLSL